MSYSGKLKILKDNTYAKSVYKQTQNSSNTPPPTQPTYLLLSGGAYVLLSTGGRVRLT